VGSKAILPYRLHIVIKQENKRFSKSLEAKGGIKMPDMIKENFQRKAVIHSNIWMYFIATAIEVVEECKNAQLKISNLEAFKLFGKGIQPDQEHSIDFDLKNGNWDEAIEFLSDEKNADYLYEIWYDGY
jgi:hypothetical protein